MPYKYKEKHSSLIGCFHCEDLAEPSLPTSTVCTVVFDRPRHRRLFGQILATHRCDGRPLGVLLMPIPGPALPPRDGPEESRESKTEVLAQAGGRVRKWVGGYSFFASKQFAPQVVKPAGSVQVTVWERRSTSTSEGRVANFPRRVFHVT